METLAFPVGGKSETDSNEKQLGQDVEQGEGTFTPKNKSHITAPCRCRRCCGVNVDVFSRSVSTVL